MVCRASCGRPWLPGVQRNRAIPTQVFSVAREIEGTTNHPPETIPHILKLEGAPGCQPPVFVRHALDSPWVESRVDVLVVTASVLVEHLLPIVCEVPTLTIQKWPIPCM